MTVMESSLITVISSSRYSGGFSPKTPKTGKRRSMKGLFRRLSGGKESSVSIYKHNKPTRFKL